MSKQQVLADIRIRAYIAQSGGNYPAWYVGIASDPRERLLSGHSVKENGDYWIYRGCDTNADARSVEDSLLLLGTNGGPGGGDNATKAVGTKAVYAYKIGAHTVE
jgi:hypothetical protein